MVSLLSSAAQDAACFLELIHGHCWERTGVGNGVYGAHGQHNVGKDVTPVGGASAWVDHEHRKHEGAGHHGTGTGVAGSADRSAMGTHPAGKDRNDTSNATGTGAGHDHTATGKKPSLMDKLNPMKDGDGDGKKRFMG